MIEASRPTRAGGSSAGCAYSGGAIGAALRHCRGKRAAAPVPTFCFDPFELAIKVSWLFWRHGMDGTVYVVLSGALTFGIPLVLAVRELLDLKRRDNGGWEGDG